MIKWYNGIPLNVPNIISKEVKSAEEHYHISYNPSHRDYGIDTTALVITIGNNEREVYYILKGNHVTSYANCHSLKESIRYFKNNIQLMHDYSDKFEHDYLLKGEYIDEIQNRQEFKRNMETIR